MYRYVIGVLLIMLPEFVCGATRLQYLPKIPVQQTSKLTMEVKESLPILNMNTKGNQMFKFDIVAQSRLPGKQTLELPAQMRLTIKDMFVLVNVNGKEVAFDPRRENAPPQLMQLSQLIDKPLDISINAHGNLENGPSTFERLFKELPALKQLPLESLLNDLISSLFALYDEDLTVGAIIEMESAPGPAFAFPAFVTYEIAEINDKEVVANLKGKIDPKKITLDKTIQLEGGRQQKVDMVISGQVKGRAIWQRSNAMLFTLNNDYQYEAKLKAGDKQWTMQMTVSQAITTAPL